MSPLDKGVGLARSGSEEILKEAIAGIDFISFQSLALFCFQYFLSLRRVFFFLFLLLFLLYSRGKYKLISIVWNSPSRPSRSNQPCEKKENETNRNNPKEYCPVQWTKALFQVPMRQGLVPILPDRLHLPLTCRTRTT